MPTISPEVIQEFKVIADSFDYVLRSVDTNIVVLSQKDSPFQINFQAIKDNEFFVYIYARTTSWDLPGERTDANEQLSVMLATFLRVLSVASCRLWDIPHPVDVPDTEVYARYLTLDQPNNSIIKFDTDGIQRISKILVAVQYFENILPKMFDWQFSDTGEPDESSVEFDSVEIQDWVNNISTIVDDSPKSEKIQYVKRINPSWLHYRNIRKHFTLYHTQGLASAFSSMVHDLESLKKYRSVGTDFYISDNFKNAISSRDLKFAEKILVNLEGAKDAKTLEYLPLENYLVAATKTHLLFLNKECGWHQFEREREKIRLRQIQERELLFPVTNIEWETKIDPEQFELLILELLKVEEGVNWIRKSGATRERDGGVDLIAEWNTTPVLAEGVMDEIPPSVKRIVVVQCKAYQKAVGKSDVLDIRDTIENNDASGYFLVVSSYLATSLSEHLRKLRVQGRFWIDWWTRPELDEKLKKCIAVNPELPSKFPEVFRISSKPVIKNLPHT